MMRVVDIFLAIPVVFLFIFISQVITPTTWLLIIVLAGLSWRRRLAWCAARHFRCGPVSTYRR